MLNVLAFGFLAPIYVGQSYRFRVISNGFLNCPIEVSVDDHDIIIVSVDGNPVKPVTAASFVIYAGERYDFVIKANRTIGLYWIRYKGGLFCGEAWTKVHQETVLQYEGASDIEYPIAKIGFEQSHKEGLQIGGIDKGSGETGFRATSELQSYRAKDDILKQQPDVKMFLTYDFYYVDNPEFHYPGLYGISDVSENNINQVVNMPLINHISYAFPPFPLLPQRDMNDPKQFCNRSTIDEEECSLKFCSCTHVIKLPLNVVVELIVIDSGISSSVTSHPMHLHGYTFRVLALKKIGRNVTEEDIIHRDRQGLIERNLVDPPEKDTLAIPTGGYAVIRFVSSNPGYWLFHCHLDIHSELGMALVFQVGENSDMLPVPSNFPQCGSYVPSTSETPSSFLYTVPIILHFIYFIRLL